MLWATGTVDGLGHWLCSSASTVYLFRWPFGITHWAAWEDGEGSWSEEKPQHAGRNELCRAVPAAEEAITVPPGGLLLFPGDQKDVFHKALPENTALSSAHRGLINDTRSFLAEAGEAVGTREGPAA